MAFSEQVAAQERAWGNGLQGGPTLVISYNALAEILMDESAVIAPEDVSGLMAAIGQRLNPAESEPAALEEWQRWAAKALAEEEDDGGEAEDG